MNLPRILREHAAGLAVVSLLLIAAITVVRTSAEKGREARLAGIQKYLALPDLNFGDPSERELFRETMKVFHPGENARVDSIVQALSISFERQFADRAEKSGTDLTGLTAAKARELAGMFAQFIAVYAAVMFLVGAAGERAGIALFIRREQRRERASKNLAPSLRERFTGALLIAGTFLAFAPAYVIAYSLKTRIDTGNVFFLLFLGVVSNGVLASSARRFYTLLVAESRKGYVEAARAHSLLDSYAWDRARGLARRVIWAPLQSSRGHIFHQIVANAKFQSRPALKEQASFVITGLVIIEMALNLQGRLCYELLQNMLYRQYDVVLAIVLGIFWIVKGTEIAVDLLHAREARRYENR